MSRFVDRGAIVAAMVGVGMAVTLAISFLLVIPILPAYALLSVPAGLIIGYYANARSARTRGQWRRLLPNGLLAGVATGLTLAALLLGTRALFFFADNGYPNFNRVDATGTPIGERCEPGADCVYHRYRAEQPRELAAAGVTDAASFSTIYWSEAWSTAGLLVLATTGAAIAGAGVFGLAGPRRGAAVVRSAASA